MEKTGFGLKNFSRANLISAMGTIDWEPRGKVCDVVGTVIEAYLPGIQIGTIVAISAPVQGGQILAEVAGFRSDRVLLIPFSSVSGISPGSPVSSMKILSHISVGDHLLGRVIDPMLHPLFGRPMLDSPDSEATPLEREAPNPMTRKRVEHLFNLGIRAIDGLLSFGEGQRIGILAGSGVGKSVMMGMIAKSSDADVNVIGLIGERGREVREFIERDLGPEGLAKSVVVVVTGDQSPLLKIRAAKVVTAIAEHFASRDKKVLLMMDSLTRVAMAQREIGLAVGEPPTTKGYPPSVFSLLPKLLERCGPQSRGSISGLYTVLVDGDDFNEPIADAARGTLDGHIILSRTLAARNHFPAIEITSSSSRVMQDIVSKDHWQISGHLKSLLGVYQENYDYVQIGSYQKGTNPLLDEAIRLMPQIEQYLRQDRTEYSTMAKSMAQLEGIFSSHQRFDSTEDTPSN
ncbi:MAG: FliI/YscN family ATPase [Proteobacteria bacterium]|nr:FliI/YscN family ATPase [Pseudomonadota bacterium]